MLERKIIKSDDVMSRNTEKPETIVTRTCLVFVSCCTEVGMQ